MRKYECNCLKDLEIDFDIEGAFCPKCEGYVIPIDEGLIEEMIWQSELCKNYINYLSQYAGEGFEICKNRLAENISNLAKIFYTSFHKNIS